MLVFILVYIYIYTHTHAYRDTLYLCTVCTTTHGYHFVFMCLYLECFSDIHADRQTAGQKDKYLEQHFSAVLLPKDGSNKQRLPHLCHSWPVQLGPG